MPLSKHIPVLLHEVIELLNLAPGKNVIDATVGGGGHAKAILERTAPQGQLLGIDADGEAIACARIRLKEFGGRVTLVQGNFMEIRGIRERLFRCPVHAVLFDLGFSSDQLADASRGFSFTADGPLDMRFSGKGDASVVSARELVNTWPEAELARIIRQYGEERYAKTIAHSIVVSRRATPVETTQAFVSCILAAVPSHARRAGRIHPAPTLTTNQKSRPTEAQPSLRSDRWTPHVRERSWSGVHPATRTFQALRMAVNEELDVLEEALPQAAGLLEPRGRLAVISFHSLEDRIVKRTFLAWARQGIGNIITPSPITPSRREMAANPRSRSAKLRVFGKHA